MTSYLIKSILCSGILILVYHLFLEREKMLRFNRFYLLAAVIFSIIVPSISFDLEWQPSLEPVVSKLPDIDRGIEKIPYFTPPEVEFRKALAALSFDIWAIAFNIIVGLLMTRFVLNVIKILRLKSTCKQRVVNKAKLMLVPHDIVTFTFLDSIFVPEKLFENQQLRDEILVHESAHARQMHSLDIIFIELVQVFLWINPFLIWYKKAIRLNHEFLADEAVLEEYTNVKSYQLLLLDTILYRRQVSLTSSFNYSITKKRLAMMTKIKSVTRQYAKQGMIALLTIALGFLFSERIYSQNGASPKKSVEVKAITFEPSKGEGVSEEKMKEFKETIDSHTYVVKDVDGRTGREVRIEPKLKEHLYDLYSQMSRKQQTVVRESGILLAIDIPEKKSPTKEMFENWKKPEVFGVWIDGRHVSNKALDELKNTDIAEYSLSKLYGAAKKGRSYKYQLDLTTNKNFDENLEARNNDRVSIYLLNLFTKKN